MTTYYTTNFDSSISLHYQTEHSDVAFYVLLTAAIIVLLAKIFSLGMSFQRHLNRKNK